jgi:hypothetical protein
MCALSHAESVGHLMPLRADPKVVLVDETFVTNARESLVVPPLNSRPGATATLYIDFDGDFSLAPWGGSVPGTTPAFDLDGNPSAFSPFELSEIQEIWASVAEKYSPFNINVSTVAPPVLSNRVACRVVVGGDGAWFGNAGGVAYVDAFTNGASNTAWTFSAVYPDSRWVAEVTAHEAGHMFGLEHQSLFDASGNKLAEYYAGDGISAPIMGSGDSAPRGTWWSGPSSNGPLSIQSDLTTLARAENGFRFSPDVAGQHIENTGPTTGPDGNLQVADVIQTAQDQDWWMFDSTGGAVSMSVATAVADNGVSVATLDASIAIRRFDGSLVASAAGTSLNESLDVTLPAGRYVAVVQSAGRYGDVGQYQLSLTGATRAVTQTDFTGPRLQTSNLARDIEFIVGIGFNELNVDTADLTDLVLTNLSTGQVLSASQLFIDEETLELGFQFPTAPPDGRYRAVVPAGAVADAVGNPSFEAVYEFTFIRGDADNDGDVDFADLLITVQNYGQTGQYFSQGNFDYDPQGRVDFADLLLVTQRFGTSLSTAPAARSARAARRPLTLD